jgi:O-acetyl-ADP-ribose deacetylase (regulator of RNase III)
MSQSHFSAKLSAVVTLSVMQGDITEQAVDAIVNAANEHLAHGGGVALAIARKGGPEIQAQSNAWVKANGPVKTGSAVILGGGALKAKRVIHTVGPVWGSGDEINKLASAVKAALRCADDARLRSVALPAISAGIYGFPAELCAQVLLGAIQEYVDSKPGTALREIRVVLFDEAMSALFLAEAKSRFD